MSAAQVFRCPELRQVHAGVRFETAAVALAEEMGARRVAAFVSRSLLADTDLGPRLRTALGERLAGLWPGAGSDIIDAQVLAHAALLAQTRADLVLTIGGGALIDGAKMALLARAHAVTDAAGLAALRATRSAAGRLVSGLREPLRTPHVVVPTTLTGAEYSDLTGSSPAAGEPKAYYLAPGAAAVAVVHDPWLVQHTPMPAWLRSGMRAVDHAIEGYCSIRPHPLVDAAALAALRHLRSGLEASLADPHDAAARSACLTGAWLAGTAVGRVPFGASHGLGHLLAGSGGVPHGLTSALLLPAVLARNAEVNAARQADCAAALGHADTAATLHEQVQQLVARLGLASAVAALQLPEPLLREIAAQAATHFVVASNPVPLSADAVLALLRAAGLGGPNR